MATIQQTAINIDEVIINTIRTLSMDGVQKANSGHPGTPMALAPVAFTIWDKFMRFNPRNPDFPNRDRFILSAGHASMLLYSVLHITGYDVSLEDLKQFRQMDSKTPGHPEYGITPGVETTTGPLGQGVATSVGFAIAERWLKHYFNRPGNELIDYNVFAIAGDGDMMEGVSGEAASLAGHLGLSNLIWIYDNNRITIEGGTSLAFSEDVATRFLSYNWNVQRVGDANDTEFLERALQNAVNEGERPSLIIVDSHIAFGSPNKQDTAGAHGAPLGQDEIRATKQAYGWNPDQEFYVPPEVEDYRSTVIEKGIQVETEWNDRFEKYRVEYPDLAREFELIQQHKMPDGWDTCIPEFDADEKGIATRKSNGQVLNAIAKNHPWLFGGSADLSPSTNTLIDDAKSFLKGNYDGRNFHFGIREHAMGAVANGMALSNLRPYAATFLIFSDYMRPAIRLSALMEQPVIYIFTHDSIGLGEDGPTHQPVEQIASLRAIPNLDVIRPADANELAVLWKHVMELKDRPVAMILSRQGLPTVERTHYASAEGALKGAYILADSESTPDVILMGTGSEIQLCLSAYEKLMQEGISTRVVSMPCWELFERQNADYKESVLPSSVDARVSVEAGSTFGWRRYTGRHDECDIIGLREFGASAPIKDLYPKYGFTVDAVVQKAKDTHVKMKGHQ